MVGRTKLATKGVIHPSNVMASYTPLGPSPHGAGRCALGTLLRGIMRKIFPTLAGGVCRIGPGLCRMRTSEDTSSRRLGGSSVHHTQTPLPSRSHTPDKVRAKLTVE